MISDTIRTTLQGFCNGRVYPNTFPQPPSVPVWPAMRFTIISADPVVSLCGDGGPETADSRVQIDIVDKQYKSVQTLKEQVISAMQLMTPPTIWESEFNDFDADTKTHRCVLDFVIYPSST